MGPSKKDPTIFVFRVFFGIVYLVGLVYSNEFLIYGDIFNVVYLVGLMYINEVFFCEDIKIMEFTLRGLIFA